MAVCDLIHSTPSTIRCSNAATELEPGRVRAARLRLKDSELRQSVGLFETDRWKGLPHGRKRTRRHGLRAIVMISNELRSCCFGASAISSIRRNVGVVGSNWTRCVSIAVQTEHETTVLRGDEGAAMAEHVKQGIDAANMVEQQETQRAVAGARVLEFREKLIEIKHRGLAVAG